MEIGGEIAKNIDRIYEYIHYLLVQGNLKKSIAPIKESIEHMKAMRDTWKEAFEKYQKELTTQEISSQEKIPSISHTSTVDLSI